MAGIDAARPAQSAGTVDPAPAADRRRFPLDGRHWRNLGLGLVVGMITVAVPPLLLADRQSAGDTPAGMGASAGASSPMDTVAVTATAPSAAVTGTAATPSAAPMPAPGPVTGSASGSSSPGPDGTGSPGGSVAAGREPQERSACTPSTVVGDVGVQVCWVWSYLGTGTATWRPQQLRLVTTDVGKRVSVLVQTSPGNSPAETYLGVHGGGTIWEVPGSYDWDMTSGTESTTTVVARRLPNQRTECFVRFRHQPSGIFVLGVSGVC